jgi:pyrophosphate--fructose-6-phosphate 1-phosphotransferase
MDLSPLQKARKDYRPSLAKVFTEKEGVIWKQGEIKTVDSDVEKAFSHLVNSPIIEADIGDLTHREPLVVGVVFSGGQAAGGHNCLWGLYDALKKHHLGSRLFGFLNGPSGVIDGKYKELMEDSLKPYYNEGGFDCLGSGRTKIETEEQFQKSHKTIQMLGLDALIVIGGDDTNTNAALLSEYLLSVDSKTSVIGLPKTIDGDMRGGGIEISFGFDSAANVYAELIGNIARDAASSGKYYHFIKIMGRTATHLALECALQVRPNLTLVGEEIAEKKSSLADITKEIADLVEERAKKGKHHGVVVFPEGLIEFIPEMKNLVKELNALLASFDVDKAISSLSSESKDVYDRLPLDIQGELSFERDPHGNVQVSLIQTEKLFANLVQKELKKRGQKFSPLTHFFGYEGRSCLPSNFDANYCYNLGFAAAHLAIGKRTGYIVSIKGLSKSIEEWVIRAIPLVNLIHFEIRKGKSKPVIVKKLVDLRGPVFKEFARKRADWRLEDHYLNPGPIQYFGPTANKISLTLSLENQ